MLPIGAWRRATAWLLVTSLLACSSASSPGPKSAFELSDPEAVRYRLRLRENPVDPGQAFRCYGQCQSQGSPQGYLECLTECPGFEITQGMRCDSHEVPPVAACFTARQVPLKSEPGPGWLVLAVIANVALVVTLASVCASSSSQCGYGYPGYYPGASPVPPPY
jgi:hypothetical protein